LQERIKVSSCWDIRGESKSIIVWLIVLTGGLFLRYWSQCYCYSWVTSWFNWEAPWRLVKHTSSCVSGRAFPQSWGLLPNEWLVSWGLHNMVPLLDGENRSLDLVGGSRSLRECPLAISCPGSFLYFLPTSFYPEVSSFMLLLLWYFVSLQTQKHRGKSLWTELSDTWSQKKKKFFSFKLFIDRFFCHNEKSY
jgi:hypothetical protein